MEYFILDKNNKPIPATWDQLKEMDRHVSLNQIGDVRISTVFLTCNHNFDRRGPPILWETMIFGGEHDSYQERYTSYEDALIGHQKALELVMAEKKSE